MGRFVDLTGQKFGRLTVIERAGTQNGHAHWRCKCKCGNDVYANSGDLTNGKTHSCGCWVRETTSKRNFIHGLSCTRIRRIFGLMKDRCTNENNPQYKDYGGRGIKICDEWLNNFVAFKDWAFSNGYSDKLSIDRIDNNGNYEPSNCRWTDRVTQANNTRNNRFIKVGKDMLTIAQAAHKFDINATTLWCRVNRGVSENELFIKGRCKHVKANLRNG